MGSVYLENLDSLGMLEVSAYTGTVYYTPSPDMPEDRSKYAAWFMEGGGEPRQKVQSGGWIKMSNLGQRFIEACVRTPPGQRSPWEFTWD